MVTLTTSSGPEAPLVLAIDVGSSSARALLYDARGRAVDGVLAQAAYALTVAADGASELDPKAVLACVGECIDAALQQAGPLAAEIRAVGCDTLASTFLALDDAGRPLTPVITYADTRNAPDALALQHAFDEAVVHDRTGCLLRTSYWPARLAWLRRTRPEVWSGAAAWVTLGEWLEREWFGVNRVSTSAAAWTGLLDRRTLEWDAPLLATLGASPDQFAPLVDVSTPARGLREPYVRRWPALCDVPWFPAIGDGAAANIGSGCVGPDRVALTLGTTGALRVVLPEVAVMPPGLWCYRVDGARALLGGATSEGGNVYAWLSQTLRLGDADTVEAQLAAQAPDGHGLTVLPFVAGERSPGWAGDVPATFHGLTLATTPIGILRAGLEAVAYRFALILQSLPLVNASQPLIASGGALQRSPAWAQIFADVLGREVVLSAEPEATSRGVAVLALEALGHTADPASTGRVFAPIDAHHRRYAEAVRRQQMLYERVIPGRGSATLRA